MKFPVFTPALSLLLIACMGTSTAEEIPSAVMRFLNEDHLSGKLKALGDDKLVWESDLLSEPATFDLKHVLNLTLNAEDQSPEGSHIAVLNLANGDEVHGQLKNITDEAITLDTWFGGIIHFNRVMVSKIQISGGNSHHYRGPSSMEGWKQSPEGSWEYKRQSFISSKPGSIARDKMMPDECSIKFTAERKSDSLDLKLMLFSNDVSLSRPRSGYELSFQRSSVYLRSGKTRNFLGSSHSQDLSQNDTVEVEIRASRKVGKVALLINGKLIEVWNEPNVDSNEFGSGLHFISGNNGALRISKISVGPWDGKINEELEPRHARFRRGMEIEPNPADDSEEDQEGRMQLANGDSLKGTVLSIEEGLIQLETPLGKINLPIERLRSLNLDGLNQEKAKLENGDIRAFFADGSTLVFRLDKVDGDRITGVSQNFATDSKFGEAIFDLSAISRIEFQPHEEKLKSLRSSQDW